MLFVQLVSVWFANSTDVLTATMLPSVEPVLLTKPLWQRVTEQKFQPRWHFLHHRWQTLTDDVRRIYGGSSQKLYSALFCSLKAETRVCCVCARARVCRCVRAFYSTAVTYFMVEVRHSAQLLDHEFLSSIYRLKNPLLKFTNVRALAPMFICTYNCRLEFAYSVRIRC